MAYENFYYGTAYPLEPEYGELFTGYRIPASKLGLTTDPRTANQLQEVSAKINPGGKIIEVSTVDPRIFEAVPEQHLKEINRLSKLTGTELSVHGPAVEPSGYTEQGWSEANRQLAENQILSAIERSHKLNPEGNIPVTFHPSYTLPEGEIKVKEKVKGEWKIVSKSRVLLVDPRTGEVSQIREAERFFPEEKMPEEFEPKFEIEKRNKETWDKILNEVNFYATRGEEYVNSAMTEVKGNENILKISREKREEILKKFPELEKMRVSSACRHIDHASLFLRDSYNMLKDLYNRIYQDADLEDKQKLNAYASKIKPLAEKGVERDPEKIKEFVEIIEEGVNVLGDIKSPKILQPFDNFLIDKTSETFSNIAVEAYRKFGDKAPLLSIENGPAGTALSRAEELKKLIEESRKKFVEKAKAKGMSQSEAEGAAEKLIGATWDIGHINMLRKYGYDKVDIIKETEKIAPFVKHVHLSDNFGYEHTELPMGMGTVPFKEIMEKLGKKGEEVKKIIEAASWYQFFKTSPLTETLEAGGSPLIPMKAPYWNQIVSSYGSYFAFPSAYFPEQHFSIYGSGFSGLPQELGGQIPGKQARFGGTPMA